MHHTKNHDSSHLIPITRKVYGMFRIYVVFLLLVMLLVPGTLMAQSQNQSVLPDQLSLNRLHALGQAYMEQDDFANAIEQYQAAVEKPEHTVSDLVNLGLALYHNGDNDEAIATMTQALEQDTDLPHALYILGLAHKKVGKNQEALEYFQQTYAVDSDDIPVMYNIGLALSSLGEKEEAIGWFEKILELDPDHSAATYQLALALRGQNNERMTQLLQRFRELKENEENLPTDYFDEGAYFTQINFEIPRDDQVDLTSDLVPVFERNRTWEDNIQETIGTERDFRPLDHFVDVDQKQNWVIYSTQNAGTHLLKLSDSVEVIETIKLSDNTYRNAKFVDYNNDVQLDMLLYSDDKVTLLKHGEDGYEDVTEAAGIDISGASDVFWADFDHEGDLDLFIANTTGDKVYQNNGDDTFTDITNRIDGLPAGKSRSIVLSDLDNDNDLDIVQLTADNKLVVYDNLREVRFKKVSEVEFEEDLRYSKLIISDVNNDRQMDLIVTQKMHGTKIWTTNEQKELIPLDFFAQQDNRGFKILKTIDANNDGYDDFVTMNSRQMISSQETIESLTLNTFPDPITIDQEQRGTFAHGVPIDLDFDGDLDFLSHWVYIFENTNGNQNNWLVYDILGKKNATDGFGSKIEVKDDLFYVKKELTSQTTHIGLGDRERIDVLRTTWPNGIFQNIVHATANQILSASERPGYAGSCPFLYTWNGDEFEFVADCLSTGPLGLYLGGGYFPPRPEEYARIRNEQLQPKNDTFQMLFREELRELTYFDRVGLLSVTHSDDVTIYSHDQFTLPPFPEFKLVGMSKEAIPPRKVVDHFGNDVTDLIAKQDRRYPRPFKYGNLEGVNDSEYWFEIDLNNLPKSETLYMFMTGYVDWPNSSVARSLEQNPSLDFTMPYLQVLDENGEWETIMNPMGFPAGKLKTVPIDISDIFKNDDRRIRIVATMMVHWDEILIDPAPVLDGFEVQHHSLKSAHLHFGGYSHMYELDGVGPHWYDYNQRTTNQRWDMPLGNYTRYGDVLPLLTEFDDQYVIMGPGDEIAVEFDANGITDDATYFVHLNGWVKDVDYSTAFSNTVEPLPFKGLSGYPLKDGEMYPYTEDNIEYLLKYNTRVVRSPNEPLKVPERVTGIAPNLGSPGETR